MKSTKESRKDTEKKKVRKDGNTEKKKRRRSQRSRRKATTRSWHEDEKVKHRKGDCWCAERPQEAEKAMKFR